MEQINLVVFLPDTEDPSHWIDTFSLLGWQHLYAANFFVAGVAFRQQWGGEFARQTYHFLTECQTEGRILDWYIKGEESPVQWEVFYRPFSVGGFQVYPDWLEVLEGHSEQAIILKQSLGFGTGQHPATQMMLRFLPTFLPTKGEIADIGAGTGILAIAALKCGSKSVFCCDLHPWMETDIRQNLSLNKLSQDKLRFSHHPLSKLPSHAFQLALCNISASFHIEHAGELCRILAHNGYLLVSGLRTHEAEAVCAVFTSLDCFLVQSDTEDTWWCGVFQQQAHRTMPKT